MSRRGTMVAMAALGSACVLAGLGLASSAHVSAGRATLARVHLRRVADLAALSAVEEACVRVEAAATLPESVDPVAARAALAPEGVTFGPVAVSLSDRRVLETPLPGGRRLVQDTGVLELSVEVAVRGQRARLTARRYAARAADGRLTIERANLTKEVRR